jgi:peptidoglycan/LPS O-acetylase OafA/YrhL
VTGVLEMAEGSSRTDDGLQAIVRFEDEPKPTGAGRGQRWAALDGLRALAVGIVVARHFALHSNGGFAGVDVFFVISGFLITSLLLDERDRTGTVSFRNFWARRALRLFPALVVAITFALLMSLAVNASLRHQTVAAVPAVLLYVGNWWTALAHGHSLGLLSSFWSLAVEEQFYVLWPILAVVWLTKTPHRARAACIIGILSIADCVWSLVASHLLKVGYVYYRSDTHAMGLLAGSALALFLSSKGAMELKKRTSLILRLLGVAAVLTILGITVGVRFDSETVQQLAIIAATLASSVLVLQLVLAPSGMLSRIFKHPICTWFGRRSYGIYLFNYPITVVLLQHDRQHNLHRLVLTGLGLIAIVALTAASYRWVEQPFLRRKGRFTPDRGIMVRTPDTRTVPTASAPPISGSRWVRVAARGSTSAPS